MPTYEYRCPNGHDFEQFFRKISDSKSALPCPVCGAEAARLISGGAGLLFKGSGFYITDYGKDGKKDQKSAGSAKASEGASESKGETKSDAKSGGSGGSGGAGGEGAAPAKTESAKPVSPPSSSGGGSSSKPGGDA